jgi:chaperone required for assembly of F1-ATPase
LTNLMRDLFEDIAKNQPLDPAEAVRRHMRPRLMRRFYADVSVARGDAGFALRLDGRVVKTPARHIVAAPVAALADALAAEWRAQGEQVDPATMPLTRLANTIIDGIADAPGPVAAEIKKYLGTDMLFYRAGTPAGLVARQAAAWDPILDWARTALSARFVLSEGFAHLAQPEAAIAAAGAAFPSDPWRLGALSAITTLTGSALIALAVLHQRLSPDAAWAAAHVDEDWNMDAWGRDTSTLDRRAFRFTEMQAAAKVLEALRG